MSGPKTSRYTLTEAQRRWLAEQQQIRQATRIAQQKKGDLCKRIDIEVASLKQELQKMKEFIAISGKGSEEIITIERMFIGLQRDLHAVNVTSNTETLESLDRDNIKLEDIKKTILSLRMKAENTAKAIEKEYRDELTDIITKGISVCFSKLVQKKSQESNPFISKIKTAFEQMEQMELSKELTEQLDQLKRQANEIDSMDYLENFCSMMVYPLLHSCEFYIKHNEEFEDLMRVYLYLSSEVGEKPKTFSLSIEGIENLKSEIRRLKEASLFQQEQSYISETIDQIMVDIGYELAGDRDVIRKNGRHFHNELYVLENGVGVNVTFSDTGQIAMELGALDDKDRYPSEEEARNLVEDMRGFCEKYRELEARLQSHGIVSTHISLLPPTQEYAQVINTKEYNLKKPIDYYRAQEKRKSRKEEKYKVMKNG